MASEKDSSGDDTAAETVDKASDDSSSNPDAQFSQKINELKDQLNINNFKKTLEDYKQQMEAEVQSKQNEINQKKAEIDQIRAHDATLKKLSDDVVDILNTLNPPALKADTDASEKSKATADTDASEKGEATADTDPTEKGEATADTDDKQNNDDSDADATKKNSVIKDGIKSILLQSGTSVLNNLSKNVLKTLKIPGANSDSDETADETADEDG